MEQGLELVAPVGWDYEDNSFVWALQKSGPKVVEKEHTPEVLRLLSGSS